MKSSEMNKEIRQKIARHGLRNYEVANALHINPNTFQHWLMQELPAQRKQTVLRAIDELIYAESKK